MNGLSSFSEFDPHTLQTIGYMPTSQSLFNSSGLAPIGGGIGSITSGGPSMLGKAFGNAGLGFNLPTLDLGLSGLKTLGSLWAAMQSAKIAKKQLNFTRDVTNTNLANQTQSYNTILADKAHARGRVEGKSDAQVSDYIAQNSLAKRTI